MHSFPQMSNNSSPRQTPELMSSFPSPTYSSSYTSDLPSLGSFNELVSFCSQTNNHKVIAVGNKLHKLKRLSLKFEALLNEQEDLSSLKFSVVYPSQRMYTEVTFDILEINRMFHGSYFQIEKLFFEWLTSIICEIFYKFKQCGGYNDFRYCPDFPLALRESFY